MTTIALIPLDDRPPNYDFPQSIGRIAGVEVLLPPRAWLGNLWRGAQIDRIVSWLYEQAPRLDAAIVAIDTLGYGGLVNSRQSYDSVETVLSRLTPLRELKRAHPGLALLGFNVLMRITRGNTAEEEKPYWGVYGARLFRLSYLSDKVVLGDATAAEADERARLEAELPADVIEDYRQGRARNHAVNRAMLQWTREGVFDYLLIPQDDTVEYGWNIAESRTLRQEIRALGLSERAITYPGADDIGMILLARVICQTLNWRPQVWDRYSTCRAPQVITAYEDRPMPELIKAHLAPLGGSLTATPDAADFLLFVNSPAEVQGVGAFQLPLRWSEEERARRLPGYPERYRDLLSPAVLRSTQREMNTALRDVDEFVRAIGHSLARGQTVAVADVAFVNGADLALGEQLLASGVAPRLAAFGGWNTAGNTLGTVLAHAVARVAHLRRGGDRDGERAHIEFLFSRFLDDYAHQTIARTEAMLIDLPALGIEPIMTELPHSVEVVQEKVAARLQEQAAQLTKYFRDAPLPIAIRDLTVHDVYLPWRRLFEIGFRVEARLAE